MSFFIKGDSNKRKSKDGGSRKKMKTGISEKISNKKKYEPLVHEDEEILSDDEFSDKESDKDLSEEDLETAQEKKLKLARKYLAEIEKEEKARLEGSEIDRDIIANRLKEDYLNEAGKLRKKVSDKLAAVTDENIHVLRNKNHRLSVTCVIISHNNKYIYSASKDATIIKWDVALKVKVGMINSFHNNKQKHNHKGIILSLAISYDNRFLASGDVNNVIHIWDPDSLNHLHYFKGHSGPITGLSICRETNSLYSSSSDRSVKVWNLEELMYVETLFGHQSTITSLDVLCKGRTVSSGGTDKSIRVWKIQEESQLIFNGSDRSIDVVKKLDANHFVTCGEDGHISVWGISRKKPLHTITCAHGIDSNTDEPNWITSIATISNSDVIASGSYDGCIKVWKIEEFIKSQLLFTIPLTGFVNSMVFSADENYLIVGVGQEHKLGRWTRLKEAKNSVIIVELKKKTNSILNGDA